MTTKPKSKYVGYYLIFLLALILSGGVYLSVNSSVEDLDLKPYQKMITYISSFGFTALLLFMIVYAHKNKDKEAYKQKTSKMDKLMDAWPMLMIAVSIYLVMFFTALNEKYPLANFNFTQTVIGNLSLASGLTSNAISRVALEHSSFFAYFFPIALFIGLLVYFDIHSWILDLIFGKDKDDKKEDKKEDKMVMKR